MFPELSGSNASVFFITLLELILIQYHAVYVAHHQDSLAHSYPLDVFFRTCPVLHWLLGLNSSTITAPVLQFTDVTADAGAFFHSYQLLVFVSICPMLPALSGSNGASLSIWNPFIVI